MSIRTISRIAVMALLIVTAAAPVPAYIPYDTHVRFLYMATKDILRLLPRAMGSYIYQNRYDFMRGMTFMTREIQVNPGKCLDLEEIRRNAYARLSRDIPYCVEALKGGEIKLDTPASNLAGRLGMIAYSIMLQKMPAFPDLEYLEKFSMILDETLVDRVIPIWLFNDGYGDFHSLGELMERLKSENMPTFRHIKNDNYVSQMREDTFALFRAPDKFDRNMIMTNVDINAVYNNMINNILQAYVYIWKCSGMDLAHPSYAAPPGTIITRESIREVLSSESILRPPLHPVAATEEEETTATAEEGAPAPGTPVPTPGQPPSRTAPSPPAPRP
ncbi:MAG: hypothetical protein WBG50_02045 [Desulfomonilaceae bacterium]